MVTSEPGTEKQGVDGKLCEDPSVQELRQWEEHQ